MKTIAAPAFAPAAWLRNPHAQTIYGSRWSPRPAPRYRRVRWSTPDHDFIDVDLVDQAAPASAPWLILFHGLEGSSDSHYARTLMHWAGALGWHGAVVHFRGCSGEPNLLARAYHSGDSAEIDWVLRRFAALDPLAQRYAVGVSLGGNALLKWLGEQETAAARLLAAAVSVCAPLDLPSAGASLERGFNRFYAWTFLRTLKVKAADKALRHPGLLDVARLHAARTMRAFDDVYTAPVHGYHGVDDYWQRASSKPELARIEVPTLVINPLDDPFLPAHALPRADEVAPRVELCQPRHGGHVGFVGGGWPGHTYWLTRRIGAFLGVAPPQLPGSP